MFDAAKTVEQLTTGLNFSEYEKDRKTQLAVEKTLEIIGEAAGKVSRQFQDLHSQIPWRQIIGQQNVLIHEYGQIKQYRVWGVVTEYIPPLIKQLRQIIE